MANAATSGVSEKRSEPAPPYGLADLAAVAVWTLAIVAFFWDAVALKRALFYFDITEINYPYRDFLASELKQGRMSRWFPGLYCGMPLFSESQAGYLHPLKFLLYPWLATWQAFNLDTVGSVWLTGLATYGWLRRHVGPSGALTGCAVFGLSGFVWAHLIHTSMNNALTSVPLVFWATEWAWDRGRTAGVALGALALACQVFAGHLQDTILTILALGVYTLFRAATEADGRGRVRAVATAAAVVGLGVTLAAVQWIPSKELLDRSPRAKGLTWEKLVYGSWSPELLPTLVVREAYGTRARDTDWMDGFYPYHEMNAYLGLAAVALAVIGGAAYRDRWVAFWVVLAGVGFLLMLGKFTFLFDHAHQIPVIGSSRIPVRFHLWVSLAVAALAAVGVDRLARGEGVSLRGAAFVAGLMAVASVPILLYVYLPALAGRGRWTLPYHISRYRWLGRELAISAARTALTFGAGAVAAVLARRARSARGRALAAAAIPVVVIADLLGAHWDDVPTVDPSYWTSPPVSARMLKADPSFTRVFGLADLSAGEPGYASEPVNFFAARDTLDWSLPPVWGLASSGGETPIIPQRMLDYTDHAQPNRGRFDVESVSHLVTGRRTNPGLKPGVPAGSAEIHANRKSLPRVRLLGRPVYARDQADAAAAIDRIGPAIRERVIVEDPDHPLAEDAEVAGTAKIVRDDPERVEVETDSAGPSYLFLADAFDPGWSATVDGKAAPVRPADVAFRAVFLPAGKHKVAFAYRPAGFAAGLAVSLAAAAVALVLLAQPRRLPPLADAHRAVGWRAGWPRWFLAGLVAVVAASAVKGGPEGVGLSSRWAGSFHTFTWGAGVEAMGPPPGR